jgi:RNA polymerase sigma factor (TIGR02999 family)
MSSEPDEVTRFLERIRRGEAGARDQLISVLYDPFRQWAQRQLRHEPPDLSLWTTDLTHEALLRLLNYDELAKAADKNQLFRAFARAMRQVLIDHARRRKAGKRGGGRQREVLDDLVEAVHLCGRNDGLPLDDLNALHEALAALAADHQREAQVVEMRYFGGYQNPEIAEALDVSLSTVEKDSRFATAWLREFLSPGDVS